MEAMLTVTTEAMRRSYKKPKTPKKSDPFKPVVLIRLILNTHELQRKVVTGDSLCCLEVKKAPGGSSSPCRLFVS